MIRISVGADAQAVVNAAPEGATFWFDPGVHRLVSIAPKNGQTFLGDADAVISGAKLLTGFTQQGSAWFIGGQTQQGERRALDEMQPGFDHAGYPNVVFMDDKPLIAVDTRAELAPGKYFFDYAADRIYLGDNPAGRKIEAAVSPFAFASTARDVTIQGLTIEKYATPIQYGAIGYKTRTEEWTIAQNEVRLNFGVGIIVGDNSKILGNFVHNNGQMGVGGNGNNILVQGNELAANGFWSGIDVLWEGGGSKFAETEGLIVRSNYSHGNNGYGLWTDIDNINTLYEYNRLEGNSGGGINHEISFDAIIRNNSFLGNGSDYPTWLWGAAIQIQNSRNVQVYGNLVDMAAGANGISLIQQDRGSGPGGRYLTTGNDVHDNVLIASGRDWGGSGAIADAFRTEMLAGNNRFDRNSYHLLDPQNDQFAWGDFYDWAGYRAASGQDLNSRVFAITATTPTMHDIIAARAAQGIVGDARTGDTTYGFNNTSGDAVFDFSLNPNPVATIFDKSGTNTIDLSGFTRGNRLDLTAGAASDVGGFMTGNLIIAADAIFKNGIGGAGDDILIGNFRGNTLKGNAGDDFINGGGNADRALYDGLFATYRVTESRNAGGVLEIRVASPTDGTDTLINIERLQFKDGAIIMDGGRTSIDSLFYAKRNKDVFSAQLSPTDHYMSDGWQEGRDPSAFFSTLGYLAANPDVKRAGINPLAHYDASGWREMRDPTTDFDTRGYLALHRDVAAAGTNPLEHWLEFGQFEDRPVPKMVGTVDAYGFDAQFYLMKNADVAAAGVDAAGHFYASGWREGRAASNYFDTAGYLAKHGDVRDAGVNPLLHYAASGWKEGRDPSAGFDTRLYLQANGDVAAARIDPMLHYMSAGINEGRASFSDGLLG